MDLYKKNKIALSLFAALILGLQLINSVSAADKIPVISNAPGPSITFTASPSTISIGDSSKLEWNSPSADSCKFVGGSWFGLGDASIPTSGDKANKVVNPSKDTTYKIYCTNKSGTLPAEVTVGVNRCPAGNSCHGATIDLKINGSDGPVKIISDLKNRVVFEGIIKVTSTRPWWAILTPTPDNCYALDPFAPGGNFIVPLGTYTFGDTIYKPTYGSYTLTASCPFNLSGDVINDSVNVVIEKPTTQQASTSAVPTSTSQTPKSKPLPSTKFPVPTATLTANPTSIIEGIEGESSILTWSSIDADNCTGTNFGTSNKPNGNYTVKPTSTTNYFVTCSGKGGTSVPVTATVTVIPQKETLSCTLNSVPSSGTASFNPILTATVSGTATGTIHYQFDCGNSNKSDVINSQNPYSTNSCSYQTAGAYNASVHIERGTAPPADCTTTINVAPAPLPSSVDIKIQLQ